MQDLIRHLVEPVVTHPDAIKISAVEGDAVLMLEMSVHPDDQGLFEGDNDTNLRAVRSILSAAAGGRKATLDLVEEVGAAAEE